jgi:hypothetical protein
MEWILVLFVPSQISGDDSSLIRPEGLAICNTTIFLQPNLIPLA